MERRESHDVIIALGSNIGDRRANLDAALEQLFVGETRLIAKSDLYRSRALTLAPTEEGPWYLNAAVRVTTSLTPRELIERLQEIERAAGRRRRTQWDPRPLDLDIIFYGNLRVDDPDLRIPHPRWHERDFVIRPLMDLKYQGEAESWPESEKRLSALLGKVKTFVESQEPWGAPEA